MNVVDFSEYKQLPYFYSGKNGNKIAVKYNDELYMIKFPPDGKGRNTELSYLNSCFSEHIGSTIFNMVGIKAQKTFLAKYNDKIVCACKDFTADGSIFYSFGSFRNGINTSSNSDGSDTNLDTILEAIYNQSFINPVELEKYFWSMFIIDALIGNFDRHNDNWGLLKKGDTLTTAPVFDCGSSLLPQANESLYFKILSDSDEMNSRIYLLPTSAIKYNNKKINYFKFLSNIEFDLLRETYIEVFDRVDIDDIKEFIAEEGMLTPLQKRFYSTYIEERYNKILAHTFKSNFGNKV